MSGGSVDKVDLLDGKMSTPTDTDRPLYGDQHQKLLSWLADDWLSQGPPICVVEGASGVGKTSIARALMKRCGRTAVMVDFPSNQTDELDDLLLDLAAELFERKLPELADAVDAGQDLSRLFPSVLEHPVLLIVDEFQRALRPKTAKPRGPILDLLKRTANRVQSRPAPHRAQR